MVGEQKPQMMQDLNMRQKAVAGQPQVPKSYSDMERPTITYARTLHPF